VNAVAAPLPGRTAGWLRGTGFDLVFVLGAAAAALLVGAGGALDPSRFSGLRLANLWLLGMPHVVATFTRLCFDRSSFRAHRFLVLHLPFYVLAGVAALTLAVGPWVLVSVYLYWQWFHYTRQSYGIAQAYRRRSGGEADGDERVSRLAVYLFPLWGILRRSSQDPGSFLGLELRVLPVPVAVVSAAGVAAAAAALVWTVGRARLARRGRLPLAHTLYVASHLAVFTVGYIAIDDIDTGWLAVNVWHNAQYLAFVWAAHNGRFHGRVDPHHRLLSTISRDGRGWSFLAVCVAGSAAVYSALQALVGAVPALFAVYHVINYHHYVVDAVIWKRGAAGATQDVVPHLPPTQFLR
jgi:hypothetical protein